MNIFILDLNHKLCAQYHCNKHCVKMITETTQLLNNVCIMHDKNFEPFYKLTHAKHPATIWAATNVSNFDWLNRLGLELCKEYTYRYHRVHKCQTYLESFLSFDIRKHLPSGDLTDFAKCMPDEYKVNDAVQSYRNYYIGAKQHIAQWKNREIPNWFEIKK